MERTVQELLQAAYQVQPVAFSRLTGNEENKYVFRVTLANGVCWVLRAYPPANTRIDVAATAMVLALLEQAEYPAERLVPAADGAPFGAAAVWRLLATQFVAGAPIDWDDAPWQQIGALLGRLHAQFCRSLLLDTLPVAERRIRQEMQLALADLNSVAGQVPPQFQVLYADLHQAIQTTRHWEQLPATLIHDDYHPGNVLSMPDGSLTVIDWDGAGTSPAILDLGFLLSSCQPMRAQRPDPARIDAVVDGYCRHHHLTAAEIEGLFDAVRFRPITFLTSELARMVLDPGWQPVDYSWWQARYAAGAEIAALAQARFEQYRSG